MPFDSAHRLLTVPNAGALRLSTMPASSSPAGDCMWITLPGLIAVARPCNMCNVLLWILLLSVLCWKALSADSSMTLLSCTAGHGNCMARCTGQQPYTVWLCHFRPHMFRKQDIWLHNWHRTSGFTPHHASSAFKLGELSICAW